VLATFSAEIRRHQDVFLKSLANQPICTEIDLELQFFAGWYGLIGLHDAWSRFCRDVVVVSALGGVVTRTGTQLSRSAVIPANKTPLAYLKDNWPPSGYGRCYDDGPYWYVPTTADKAAQILRISNYANFSAAILASGDAPKELRACRNYLAHRNPDTENHPDMQALRGRINVPPATTLADRLAEEIVTGNITLFEKWCRELEITAITSIA